MYCKYFTADFIHSQAWRCQKSRGQQLPRPTSPALPFKCDFQQFLMFLRRDWNQTKNDWASASIFIPTVPLIPPSGKDEKSNRSTVAYCRAKHCF